MENAMPGDIFTDLPRATDANGDTLSGAVWYFYASGGLTAQAVYADADLNTSLGTSVTADSGGKFVDIFLDRSLQYRGILVEAGGDPTSAPDRIRDIDPLPNLAYDLGNADGSGAGLIKLKPSGATTALTLGAFMEKQRRDLRSFGCAVDGSTNDYDAFQDAIDSGKPLYMPHGTMLIGDGTATATAFNILVPAGLDLVGDGRDICRIQKNYYSGTSAFLNATDPDAGSDGVNLYGITFGGIPGVTDLGGVKTGKIISTGLSEDWRIEKCGIDSWNGFGISLGGRGQLVRDILFTNPTSALGCDGVHVWHCDDASNPHKIFNVGGQTGDDIVGCFPTGSGSGADGDILGVIIDGVWGESLLARLFACGHTTTEPTLSGTIANIVARNVRGKGAIQITNGSTNGGIVRNIDVEAHQVDATGYSRALYIGGPLSTAPGQMDNIRVIMDTVPTDTGAGIDGPTDNVILSVGYFDRLTLGGDLDASNATNGITFATPYAARNLCFDKLRIKAPAGTGSVISAANSSSGQEIYTATGYLHITDVHDGQTGLEVARLRDSQLTGKIKRASGSTTSIGIEEKSNCQDNLWAGWDFGELGTPAVTPQPDSVWRDNIGLPDKLIQGTMAGDMTLALTDRADWWYHTSGTPHTFTIPANASVALPVGTELSIFNANGAGAVTIAITTDTLRWSSSTGSRTLAANGTATLRKVAATTWRLTGDGIT